MTFRIKLFNKYIKEEERTALKSQAAAQLKVKQLLFQEKVAKQDFHRPVTDFLESITRSNKETSEKVLKQSKATAEAIEKNFEKILMKAAAEEGRLPKMSLIRTLTKQLRTQELKKHMISLKINKIKILFS